MTGEGGTLAASAGRDIKLAAGVVDNSGKDGQTLLSAANDLNLQTVTLSESNKIVWDANNYRKDASSTEAGSQISGAGSVALKAGADLNARAATVQAGQALTVVAGNNVNVTEGQNSAIVDEGHQHTDSSAFMSSKTTTTRDQLNQTMAVGSSLSGDMVNMSSGKDLTVRGSAVAADGDVNLLAGGNVGIVAATSTRTVKNTTRVQEDGFLSGGGGFGISYGQRITTTEQEQDGTTQSGQSRSLVGSNNGSLFINAGEALNIKGSDIAAGQDINLAGKSVTIDPGRDDIQGKVVTRMEQDALTLAIGGSVVNAIQTMKSMNDAAGNTGNSRVKALAAATASMAAANAARDIAANGVNVSISLTAGHSESEQIQTNSSSDSSGSTVAAGNNLTIQATGAGRESNINVIGSDLSAKNNVSLAADNQVNLLAAQDLEAQHSKSSSMSAAAGVGASFGTKGMAIGVTGSLSLGRAQEDGEGITQRNTYVNAGNNLTLQSGGDTSIKGAVASARQVTADIKGDLNIESLQDTAKFDSKSQNVSASGTVGMGASVSASVNQGKIENDYASVQEQSGILAGDGGFDVKVGGNTDLKGAVIAGSQTAIDTGRNSLVTASLTQSEIQNHADYDASSFGVSASASVGGGDGKDPKSNDETADAGNNPGAGKGPGGTNLMNVASKTGAGMNTPVAMVMSGSEGSTTRSGISGGAIVVTDDAAQLARSGKNAVETIAGTNRNVATGVDTSGKIGNNFNKEEIQANMAITAAFMQQASPLAAGLVGDIGKSKQDAADRNAATSQRMADDAKASGNSDEAARYQTLADQAKADAASWGDNGVNRIALHSATQALIGGLAGGGAGALSSASGVVAGNLGQQLGKSLGEAEAAKQGLSGEARDKFVNTYQQTLATLGGALGGLAAGSATGQGGMAAVAAASQGGNAAATVDVYNRQLHLTEAEKLANLKKGKTEDAQRRLDAAACALVKCADGVSSTDPMYATLQAMQREGQAYKAEQQALKATGEFVYQPYLDTARDGLTRNAETIQRAGGAVNLVAGSVGVVGGGAIAAGGVASCAETLGIGCAVAAFGGYIAKESNQQAQQGNQALLGVYKSSEGQRVLDSFNVQTYPGERDPLKDVGVDVAKLGLVAIAGKVIPKALASAEGLTQSKAGAGGPSGSITTAGPKVVGANSAGTSGASYRGIVGQVPGKVLSESDAFTVGPLGNDLSGLPGTFSGGRYATMQLDQPMTVYRAWAPGQSREFGAFWSLEQPAGSLQTRIDSALLPEWGNVRGTSFNAQATQYTTIQLPAGTTVHIGEIGSQGSSWVGGKSQLLIDGGAQSAWKIGESPLR